MNARRATMVTLGAAVAAAALLFVLSDGSSPSGMRGPVAARTQTPTPTPVARFRGGTETPTPTPVARFGDALESCATRSEASFPGAFTSPRNLVVGPLVLVGGAYTPASTVREFGGNKFPLLVKAGHTVTIRLAIARSVAGLAYGPLPQGRETNLRDTYRSVTFAACRPGRAPRRYRPEGPSGSDADGVAVTFWSGFVLSRVPACIPLDVYADGAAASQRVGLQLGRHCRA